MIEFDYCKIFRYAKEANYINISFVIKKGVKLAISETFSIHYQQIAVFTDGSEGEPVKFRGLKNSMRGSWLDNVEFHVHSEEDVKFLFS